jgi:hypothetical protein
VVKEFNRFYAFFMKPSWGFQLPKNLVFAVNLPKNYRSLDLCSGSCSAKRTLGELAARMNAPRKSSMKVKKTAEEKNRAAANEAGK